MAVMMIKKHAKLDYNSVLEKIVAVYRWKEKRIEKGVYNKCLVCADLYDRKSVCNDNYPWYKGAFGNCLIDSKPKHISSKLTLASFKILAL